MEKKISFISPPIDLIFFGIYSGVSNGGRKVFEKCTKNLIGHSRLAFNNHESNIDC